MAKPLRKQGKIKGKQSRVWWGNGSAESGGAEGEWRKKRKVNPFGGRASERVSECTHARKHETRHFYWYYSRVSSRFRGRTSISSSILNEIAARCVKSITGRVVAVQSRF